MANANVMNVNVNLSPVKGTMAVGTSLIYGFQAPSDSVGGGISITKVNFCSRTAIAAASAPVFEVVTCAAADSAINGTVSTALGSANWTAGTIRNATVADAWVDAGEIVQIQWKQTAANADEHIIGCSIEYVMGR